MHTDLLAPAVLLLSVLAGFDAKDIANFTVPSPVTVPYDRSLATKSPDVNLTAFGVANGTVPEQVHVTPYGQDGMTITWVTQAPTLFNGSCCIVAPGSPVAIPSVVRYGTSRDLGLTARGTAEQYSQAYVPDGPNSGWSNYTSGIIHHVTLTNLAPATRYHYTVGGENTSVSANYNFTTMPVVGGNTYPFIVGIVGDLGLTYNSTTTLAHMMQTGSQVVIVKGDLTYADDYTPSGAGGVGGSYQPIWDTWGRFTEPLFSTVPVYTGIGNHENETQTVCAPSALAGGTCTPINFASYNARYPMPYNLSGSTSNQYYSFDMGPAHVVMLTPYVPFVTGSPQYQWFLDDMAAVNRSRTPWLLVNFHAPWYNTYADHYKEVECMRQDYEEVLLAYGVDLSFAGHVHAYERFNPTYNYTVMECAPVYITAGDGGNVEGLYANHVDQDGGKYCPPPALSTIPLFVQGDMPFACVSLQPPGYNGGNCPFTQPDYSAFREASFGHGTLTFLNNTHAQWQWYRNQDGDKVVSDSAYIVRNPTCFNAPQADGKPAAAMQSVLAELKANFGSL